MALLTASFSQTPTRGFVDHLIRKQLIKPGFKQILAGKELEEVGDYLINHRLLNQNQLAEQYSQFFNLPLVSLTNRPVKPRVAHILPITTAEQYKVFPYDIQGTDLYLAVGQPAKLQNNAPKALLSIRQQKGLNVHLAIAPEAEIMALIKKTVQMDLQQLRQPAIQNPLADRATAQAAAPAGSTPPAVESPKSPTTSNLPTTPREVGPASKPPPPIEVQSQSPVKAVEKHQKIVDLRRLEIPLEVLNKIPLDVAKKYQLIVFGAEKPKSRLEPSLIKVAIVNQDDVHVREILSYIEARNKVLIDRYSTDLASFEAALKNYQSQVREEATEIEEVVEIPASGETRPVSQAPAVTHPPTSVESKPKSPEPIIAAPATDARPLDEPKAAEPVASSSTMGRPVAESVALKPGEEGLTVSSADIISRPTEESVAELQRLAREQEVSLEDQNLDRLLKKKILSLEDLAQVFRTGIIPEIVAASLFLAIRMKASDIHIEAEQESVRLRFRIDGILHDILKVPYFLHAPLVSRIKILSKMKIDEQRVPQDGRFDVVIDERQVDLRVSTMPTVHGEKVVMRLLDKSEGVLSLEQLGVTGSNFDRLVENIDKPYGIILSTGPTGSGKSTTLYAVLTRISKPGVNIITLEDPVEYELPGVNQAQVKPQIGFTFAEGLRSVLRQDPNIIMVGEIRDLETAAMATHAALTGHLVLSTLHTNDAAGALPRLINMGVEPFLITSSINAVIGQRLVRKICDDCREPAAIPPAIKTFVQKELSEVPSGQLKNINVEQLVFYHGKGCTKCSNGYRGRIGIFEVLAMSDKIEELAVRKARATEIKNAAIEAGMITMMQDGLIKTLKGITTIDEVMRVTTASIKEVPAG